MVLLLGRLSGPWGMQAILPALYQCASEGVVPGIGSRWALKKNGWALWRRGERAMRQLVTLNLFIFDGRRFSIHRAKIIACEC